MNRALLAAVKRKLLEETEQEREQRRARLFDECPALESDDTFPIFVSYADDEVWCGDEQDTTDGAPQLVREAP